MEISDSDDDCVITGGCIKLIELYNDDTTLPVYCKKSVDIREILEVCLGDKYDRDLIVTRRPYRVKDTVTLLLHQKNLNIKHPYDLDADNISGSFKKNDKIRFYEWDFDDDDSLIYSEVHVQKNASGKVISGTVIEFDQNCGGDPT